MLTLETALAAAVTGLAAAVGVLYHRLNALQDKHAADVAALRDRHEAAITERLGRADDAVRELAEQLRAATSQLRATGAGGLDHERSIRRDPRERS